MKYLFFLILGCSLLQGRALSETWNDISRLNLEKIKKVLEVKVESDVTNTLKQLAPGSRVVISGTRHSQGGHITYPNAVVLDMSKFNKIISISPETKTIIVQSGATWDLVQETANQHKLSVKVMQSSNIFSIGGSISANVHGRDPRFGPIIETIRSLKIALHSGRVVKTSRKLSPDLFYATIGGYGLLGVILEAEIELTDNLPLLQTTLKTDYVDYTKTLLTNHQKTNLHYGRCSFVKDKTFLRECYSTNFYELSQIPILSNLKSEENIYRNSKVFNASRHSNLGKSIRWKLQKKILEVPGQKVLIDRNNAMRPPVKFLDYKDPDDTDILQEYFIPLDRFSLFFDQLRDVLLDNKVNLLSVTLRYLKKNNESVLSYSRENMIGVVLYINIGLDQKSISKAEQWTKKLVELSHKNNGTYYLTYQRFPSLEQFQRSYPDWELFMKSKCKYDPDQVFTSLFYDQYIHASHIKELQKENGSDKTKVCQ